jgi:hypothetical protein
MYLYILFCYLGYCGIWRGYIVFMYLYVCMGMCRHIYLYGTFREKTSITGNDNIDL